MITQNWDWITDEEFQETIEQEARNVGWQYILSLPGVYEILSEELNNKALESLAIKYDRCLVCGNKMNDFNNCCP